MAGQTDLEGWHFVWNDADGTWTWQRTSPEGETLAASAFSFRSFNVCVADAELAGYVADAVPVRRLRASDLAAGAHGAHGGMQQRRRARAPGLDSRLSEERG